MANHLTGEINFARHMLALYKRLAKRVPDEYARGFYQRSIAYWESKLKQLEQENTK